MKMLFSTATVLACAILLVACGGAPPSPEQAAKQPAVGATAPDFTLNTLDGTAVTLAGLRQQGPVAVVVLRGWVGYQCPLCTRQVGELMASAQQFEDKQASVVMVYPGPAESLAQYAKDFNSGEGLPQGFHLVTDPDMKFVDAWGLRWNEDGETAYPSTFVVDRDGKVTFAKVSHSHGDRAGADEIVAAVN